jgi:hypothetical protein
MSLYGGAIGLKHPTSTLNILLTILTDPETKIELIKFNELVLGYIFKVTFSTRFNKFFASTRGFNIPTILIIKLLTHEYHNVLETNNLEINSDEFNNEIAIHKSLGSQDNLFTFCPTFIYSEQIKTKIRYTKLGKEFYKLLTKHLYIGENKLLLYYQGINLYSLIVAETINWLQQKFSEKVSWNNHVYQRIIVMEYVDCLNLETILTNPALLHHEPSYLYDIALGLEYKVEELKNPAIFEIFFQHYFSILMMIEGYVHGDLHPGNILICQDEKTVRTTSSLIDFGRSFRLDDTSVGIQYIKYGDEFMTSDIMIDGTPSTKAVKSEIVAIYLFAIARINEVGLVNYIKELETQEAYITISLISSMCYKKGSNYDSLFYYYIKKISSIYDSFFDVFSYRKHGIDFNKIIKPIIHERNKLKTAYYMSVLSKRHTKVGVSLPGQIAISVIKKPTLMQSLKKRFFGKKSESNSNIKAGGKLRLTKHNKKTQKKRKNKNKK